MSDARSKRLVVAGVVVALVILTLFLARGAVIRFAAAQILGRATGTHVSIQSLAFGGGHAVVRGTKVDGPGGKQLAVIPRIDVAYNLRELLPGSSHRFGLRSVTVYAPRITVVHYPNGTYNLPKMPQGGPSKPGAAPLNMSLRVIDGSLAVIDDTRVDPSARRISIERVAFSAAIHTDARTTYAAEMVYAGSDRTYPIRGRGVIDSPEGFTLHHWTAARVPLAQLVNYALNNATIRMRSGYLDNLDARYYGAISASAYMRGGTIAMQGVNAPIRDVHGPIDMTSAGLTTSGIVANVGGQNAIISGGVYDLRAPKFRLSLHANGDLGRLKQLAAAAAKLPVRGSVRFGMLVEGPVRSPLALIAVRSSEIDYRAMPLRDADARIAFDGKAADVLHARLRYGPFALGARGHMALHNGPKAVEAIASVAGPSDAVPYASSIVPGMQLQGLVLASGDDLHKIATQGLLAGTGGGRELHGVFNLISDGVGTVDLALQPSLLQARIAIDRPHQAIAAVVHAHALRIRAAQVAALPGLPTRSAPPVSGTIDGDVFASTRGKLLGLAGDVTVTHGAFSRISIAQAHARFAGPPGSIAVSSLQARGSFGSLDAHGVISGTNHVALEGRLRGSLAQLGSAIGNLPASGSIDAPIALVYSGGSSIAQIRAARFNAAAVRGVPINGLSATVATQGKALHVYAARATIARTADALASGTVGSANSRIALSVARLNVAAIEKTRLPLRSGMAAAGITASGRMNEPSVHGALLLNDGRYGSYPISAAGAFAYEGSTVQINGATAGLGAALIGLDGNVRGIRFGAPIQPQYDLRATLRAADAHTLIGVAEPKLAKQYIEGSVDAALRVEGSAKQPVISGTFSVPEGSVHGLAFRNLHGNLGGTPQHIAVRHAGVTVGTTAVRFTADAARNAFGAHLWAPSADLADFNDYFNTGDTLAGTGQLSLGIANAGTSIATSGDIDLSGVRFRRFDIGNTDANWHTSGRTVSMLADVGGPAGRAHVSGTAVLPERAAPAALLTQTDLNMAATVNQLDLATWLPLFGMTAPVTGTLDARATARGRYPDVSMEADAGVENGVIGRIPLQQAHVTLTAYRGRGEIRQAVVRIPYLTANGSGSFGLHPSDRLQLALHAFSPDLGRLMTTASGKIFNGTGTLDTTLHVAGTRADPQVRDDFTLASLRYGRFLVPKVWGTLTGNARTIALEHGEVDLKRGRVLVASGNAPLHLTRNAPVSFDMAVDNVDFSDFESALPQGYRLAGTMAGTMHVRGTVDAPALTGAIALHNGYFVGPVDQNPIQQINGTLAFGGTSLTLQNVRANVGGGKMQMNGVASVPNFRDLRAVTFRSTIVAHGAQFNNPQYFRGKIDANVTAYRNPGALPEVAGDISVPSARIPLTAFWNPHAAKTAPHAPIPLAFNLRATVGNDVRVQSTGVDVGAEGNVAVGGTLAAPTLDGQFVSTGGTVSFMRRFTIENATVQFSPANGIMPNVDALATTQISNPLTYIALHVTGLAPNNMNIAFDSEPQYSREQILALLSGVNNLNGTGGATLAAGGTGNFVANLASGQLNTYFTQQLLEPLSASLGNALGLQNLQLTDDFTSGFGVSAVKAFGKHITAVYSANLGSPQRRSLSIEAHHGESTSFALMFYNVDSPSLLAANTQTNLFGFNDLANTNALTPLVGSNGYTLLYEHKFQ